MQQDNKTTKHKMAFIVWLAIFPLITLVSFLLGDQLMRLPLLFRTFVMTLGIVPLVFYVVVPFYTRLFSSWLK